MDTVRIVEQVSNYSKMTLRYHMRVFTERYRGTKISFENADPVSKRMRSSKKMPITKVYRMFTLA